MENYKEEINKLQTQLDWLKSKIEKPQFETGKWYKLISSPNCIANYNQHGAYNYGNDSVNNWSTDITMTDSNLWTLATQKEVEEALIKEAVKRFPIGTKFESVSGLNEFISTGKFIKGTNWEKCLFRVDSDGSKNGIVFENGKWATPIKTKTIEELAIDFDNFAKNSNNIHIYFKEYLTEKKQEIIETLNNL